MVRSLTAKGLRIHSFVPCDPSYRGVAAIVRRAQEDLDVLLGLGRPPAGFYVAPVDHGVQMWQRNALCPAMPHYVTEFVIGPRSHMPCGSRVCVMSGVDLVEKYRRVAGCRVPVIAGLS